MPLFDCMYSPPPTLHHNDPFVFENYHHSVPAPHQTSPTYQQPCTSPASDMKPDLQAAASYHRDSGNALRAAIFERVLDSFPSLKKQLTSSEKLLTDRQAAVKTEIATSPVSTSANSLSASLPTLACDIMDDEFDSGYHSNDSSLQLQPLNQDLDLNSPQLTQMIDDVMDYSQGVQDIINDIQLSAKDSQQPPTRATKRPAEKKQKFTCDICKKVLTSESTYTVHMRRHNGQRPFPCQWCEKSFNQRSTLKTHERVHTGERPYHCSFCSKAFADFSTYTKHTRVHTGEKPYTCAVCGKGFAQSGNMIRHQQTHKLQDTTNRLMELSPLCS